MMRGSLGQTVARLTVVAVLAMGIHVIADLPSSTSIAVTEPSTMTAATAASQFTPAQEMWCMRHKKGNNNALIEKCIPGCEYEVYENGGNATIKLVKAPEPSPTLVPQNGVQMITFTKDTKLDDGKYMYIGSSANGLLRTYGPFICTPQPGATTVPTFQEVNVANSIGNTMTGSVGSWQNPTVTEGGSSPAPPAAGTAGAAQRVEEAIAAGKPVSLSDLAALNPDKFGTPLSGYSSDNTWASGFGSQDVGAIDGKGGSGDLTTISGDTVGGDQPRYITWACPDQTIACYKDTQSGKILDINLNPLDEAPNTPSAQPPAENAKVAQITPQAAPSVDAPAVTQPPAPFVQSGNVEGVGPLSSGSAQQTGTEANASPPWYCNWLGLGCGQSVPPPPAAVPPVQEPAPTSPTATAAEGAATASGKAGTTGAGDEVLNFLKNNAGDWTLEGEAGTAVRAGSTLVKYANPVGAFFATLFYSKPAY